MSLEVLSSHLKEESDGLDEDIALKTSADAEVKFWTAYFNVTMLWNKVRFVLESVRSFAEYRLGSI